MPDLDPRDFLDEIEGVIERVAALAASRQSEATALYKNADDEPVRHEPDSGSRVGVYTQTDLEIQEILLSFILERWPSVSVLAEEETPTRSAFRPGQPYCVLLDPIDGTRNYLRGGSAFCHIVSLMEGPAMLASLVYSHLDHRLFRAVSGRGATVSRAGLAPSPLTLGPAAGRKFLHHVSRIPGSLIDELGRLGYRPQVSRQNATDLLSMFDDGARGFISAAPVIYDVWSPAMVIQEAGGWLSDWRGELPAFRGHHRVPHLLVARAEADARAVLPLLGTYAEAGALG